MSLLLPLTLAGLAEYAMAGPFYAFSIDFHSGVLATPRNEGEAHSHEESHSSRALDSARMRVERGRQTCPQAIT